MSKDNTSAASSEFYGLSRIDPAASELLPELVSHAGSIKRMDDTHADRYLWSSDSTSWISPWQASELKVVMQAARVAGITRDDIVIDLGCGDGRVNLALARNIGCKGYGWDVSSECISVASDMVKASELGGLVSFHCLDFTKEVIQSQLDNATVLFAYIPVLGLIKIRDLVIRTLSANPRMRLITNSYHYPDAENWIILAEEGAIRVSVPRRQ